MKIDLNELLESSISDGFNLFLGAGFSLLAKDNNGVNIPLGDKLRDELSSKFKISANLNLSKISTILETTNKNDFYKFLRDRFNVGEFDERYKSIAKFPVKSIFTTNIDNLIHKIYDGYETHYLNDITEYGPAYGDKVAVDYIPLHGCILNENRKMIFSTIDISAAFNNEQNVWQYLRIQATKYPTIFWGYSLEDSGVIEALFSQQEKTKNLKTKWIVLHKEDPSSIEYFRALGFNIIIADTNELLEFFYKKTNDLLSADVSLINSTEDVFFGLNLPNKSSKLPVRSLKYFFMGDIPYWSDIYNNRVPQTHHFEKLLNILHNKNIKNVILTGIPASGKTTLLMQIAAAYEFKGHKLIFNEVTLNKAKMIYDRLMGEPALIFIDNFTDDMEIYNYFIKKPNVRLFLVDREYNLEIIFHKINRSETEIYNCTVLTPADTQLIFDNIPSDVRKKVFKSRGEDSRNNISMFEMVNMNITGPTINERYRGVINQLDKSEQLALDLLIMMCYVNKCRTAVSFDMISLFLGKDISGYSEIYDLIKVLGNLITEYHGDYSFQDQDYFIPRSVIISEKIIDIVPNSIFKDVFERFHYNIPHYAITRFDVFKKFAYDAFYAKKAFPTHWEEGLEFYENIVEYDSSPFIYQQASLYLLDKKRYPEAFNWIDKALLKADRSLFSIKNTHAIILFEANINSNDPHSARQFLDESMSILESCHTADLRKSYHAITYGKLAIKYYKVFGDNTSITYLKTALEWLKEEKRDSPWSHSVNQILHDVLMILGNKAP